MTELVVVYEGPGIVGRTETFRRLGERTGRDVVYSAAARGVGRLDLMIRGDELQIRASASTGPAFRPPEAEALRAEAHALVLVLDSQRERWSANEEIADLVDEHMGRHGARPVVLQLNKRDLPNALAVHELSSLNRWNAICFESIATKGVGVWEPFEAAVLIAARLRGVDGPARRLLERVRDR